METKTFEVRDAMTFIPVIAVKLEPGCEADRYLLSTSGYGTTAETQKQFFLVYNLASRDASIDHNFWRGKGNFTMFQAHSHIEKNFDVLESGAVIDIEFILKITATEKSSQRLVDSPE